MTRSGDSLIDSPCLAVDIGATKVDIAIVEPGGGVPFRRRILVAEHPHDLFDAIVNDANEILATSSVNLLGVGCAGPMSNRGEFVSPLNIPQWREFPLRQRLSDALGVEVHIEGDVRALALAEATFGGAKGIANYLSMVVSTGVGGALVIDGKLLDGASGNAGHVGHLNVVANGAQCSCGARGCLESEVSGWAIEARSGRPPMEADDSIRERSAELVGRAVGTLATVLDFNHCFVSGSVALGYGDAFFARANEAAHTVATMNHSKSLSISRSGIPADGPLLGAAVVGWTGRS